jgi:hypothetical protein
VYFILVAFRYSNFRPRKMRSILRNRILLPRKFSEGNPNVDTALPEQMQTEGL